jgi:zinc-binding alcohol dehydrogenase family protein
VKALAYQKGHPLEQFSIELVEVAEPTVGDTDLLVEVNAIGLNPGEAFIRRSRSAPPGGHVILGWEFAGTVVSLGAAAEGFAVGDRVMGTGDTNRDGCWAQRLAVDQRVVTHLPDQLPFVDAASLPIGSLTSWEAIFREGDALPAGVQKVLVIGGAGGVGSMAIQLLKARTDAKVIATASRPESREWCQSHGADLVIDHTQDVIQQLADAGIEQVDMILSTSGTAEHLDWITQALRPYGHLAVIDGGGPINPGQLMGKSLSLHTEMVFTKVRDANDRGSQARILAEVARHVSARRMRPITTTQLDGLTPENMKTAHTMLETRHTVGKIVIAT